jgi:hypothetical protein
MNLKDYLERYCILPSHLARKMKFDPTKIFRIIRDGMMPSLSIAIRIEDFTDGKVTPRDIYNECMSIKQKNKKRNDSRKKKNSYKAND